MDLFGNPVGSCGLKSDKTAVFQKKAYTIVSVGLTSNNMNAASFLGLSFTLPVAFTVYSITTSASFHDLVALPFDNLSELNTNVTIGSLGDG